MRGNTPSKEGLNQPNNSLGMEDKRVEFLDEVSRKMFFWELRENLGAGSWDNLAEKFGLHRSHFQKYLYGQILLPGKLFSQFLETFSEERKQFFLGKIRFKDKSWGAVKGGQTNYGLHPEVYAERRKKGIAKLAEMRERGLISRERYLDFNTPLSEDLCEFIGAFIGDGFSSATGSKKWVGMCGDMNLDRDYLMRYLPECVNSFFPEGIPHFAFREAHNVMYCRYASKQFYKLMIERFRFPKGVKAYTVVIPGEILNANETLLFSTIRGIFDTDGCLFFDKRKAYSRPYPRITLQIVSKPLHEQLVWILGKHFSLYTLKKKPSGFAKAESYALEIYGHKNLEKWMGLIGFSNRRHLDKYEKFEKK